LVVRAHPILQGFSVLMTAAGEAPLSRREGVGQIRIGGADGAAPGALTDRFASTQTSVRARVTRAPARGE